MPVTIIKVQKPVELSSSHFTGRHYLLHYVRKYINNDLNLFLSDLKRETSGFPDSD